MRRFLAVGVVCAVVTGCRSRGSGPAAGSDGASDAATEPARAGDTDVDPSGDAAEREPATDEAATEDAPTDDAPTDDAALDGTMTDAAVAPSTCATAARLGTATPSAHGRLDPVSSPPTSCRGAGAGTLYFSVAVPGGHELTASALATAGDPSWTPRLAALEGCDTSSCVAEGTATGGPNQRLDWVNNGSAAEVVILAVSADGPVTGAEVDVSVSLTDLSASCARPTPVEDGSLLRDQDLGNVVPASDTCLGPDRRTLFYVATLLPRQELLVSVSGPVEVDLALRRSCDDACFTAATPAAGTVNAGAETETIIIEASAPTAESAPFDLHVSMPPPPDAAP